MLQFEISYLVRDQVRQSEITALAWDQVFQSEISCFSMKPSASVWDQLLVSDQVLQSNCYSVRPSVSVWD